MLKKLLRVHSYDRLSDIGLLVLRIGVFASLFIKHGIEKVVPSSFAEMAPTFPDPAHIGHVASLVVAMFSDGICSLLLVIGLGSRLAAAYIFCVLTTAWVFTHHFMFLGKGLEPKHGELIVVYFTVSLGMALLGPGRYSIDWLLTRDKAS